MRNQKIKIILFTSFTLSIAFCALSLSEVNAQTLDPSTWQTTATGLKTQTNVDKKTAGLSFMVKDQGWPFMYLQGGVKDGGWGKIAGPVGIELGQVKVTGNTGSFSNEATDWSHNKMVFNSGAASQLTVWTSRLTSSLLIQSSASSLTFFAGNLAGNTFNGAAISSRPAGPSYPKYVAYSASGSVQVNPLSSSSTSLASLTDNWILLWYGTNSHFVETKKPLTYTGSSAATASLPQSEAYQADSPLLLIFENKPLSIKQSTEGGVEISFSGQSGFVNVLPLFGREHLKVSDTESWSTDLPAPVNQKITFWFNHLCQYPETVSESYSYNSTTDVASISETFTYLSVCGNNNSSAVSFAPLPPFLSLAKDSLQATFSGAVVDGVLPTEFGPSLGIENTNSYTWSITGLKKYTDSRIINNTGQVPPELMQELENEVSKVISSGHLAPWIFSDHLPNGDLRGDIYFFNPADNLYLLTQTAKVLSDPVRTSLVDYIKSERLNYPPEDIYNLPLNQGAIREDYLLSGPTNIGRWTTNRQDLFLKKVPLYNFFSLSEYYNLTSEQIPSTVIDKAKNALNQDMAEQDFATMYWFKGFEDRSIAVINSNRYFAGLEGLIVLAKKNGDTQIENLTRALFAKAAVLRVGMAKYPRYLYQANLVEVPSDPSWQPKYLAGRGYGYIFNYNWTGAYDDVRQVATLDQFGLFLHDHSGFGQWTSGITSAYLTPFRDMVPGLARLLTDAAKQDIEIYINKVESLFPHWYVAFAEGMLGSEHNLSHPIDSYQIFMAKTFIQNEQADKLRLYRDDSWLSSGDLFYVNKLAQTVNAYKGWSWNDPAANQCPKKSSGDADCDNVINLTDFISWKTEFITPGSQTADFNNDGSVNLTDFITWKNAFISG